jgi:hypothetical protein
MIDDYISRHVIMLGRDVYGGPDPELVLHEGNEVVLSQTPDKDDRGYIVIPTTREMTENMPSDQTSAAMLHLMILASRLGRSMPAYISKNGDDGQMMYSMGVCGLRADTTGDTNYEDHFTVVGGRSVSFTDISNYQYCVLCLPYTHGSHAVRALVTFTAYFECNMSISQDSLSNVYYVHGAIADTRNELLRGDTYTDAYQENADNLCVGSIYDHVQKLRCLAGISDRPYSISEPIRRGTLLAPVMGGATNPISVLAHEPLITAAASFCSPGASPRQLMWAYSLFVASMYDNMGRDLNTPSAVYIRTANVHDEDKQVALAIDMNIVKTFLFNNPVSQPATEVAEYRTIPEVEIEDYYLTTIGTTGTNRAITHVITDLAALRASWALGRASGNVPSIRRLFS